MYVPRAAYSLRMSFWTVPPIRSAATPCSSATSSYSSSRIAAVALIVIEVDDLVQRDAVEQRAACPRSSRSRRRSCRPRPRREGGRSPSPSASAGRTRPTGPSARAPAGSGTARSSPPRSPMPAYCRIVHSRPRYIVRVDAARERRLARAVRGRAPDRVLMPAVHGLQLDAGVGHARLRVGHTGEPIERPPAGPVRTRPTASGPVLLHRRRRAADARPRTSGRTRRRPRSPRGQAWLPPAAPAR